jgi:pyruvate/2-oxoglutarate/acetoin dehydrogenase E1 component
MTRTPLATQPAPPPANTSSTSTTREMTYLEAISDALREEMRRDETVFCLGEDIGAFGGAFKVTDGFVEEFGAARVLDTPLAENLIVGASVGAAIEGMKPVAEMQFSDFISCGFDQLVNVAGKMHYRQGIAVPMVVRLPSGGGFSGGPFHSQNPEAWFIQAPGLKVVAPATAADAKGLLTAAIRDPNPVCYLEHKGLYRYVKEEVPEGEYVVELGKARMARAGEPGEMTVIAYGSAVHLATQAAEELDEDIEVIDLRSLCPLDTDAILASARRTGKVLVAHEATQSCGVGAEVAALVAAEVFEDLDAPVRRLTAPDVPIPFSPPLEQAVLPQLDDMKEACDELLRY